MVLDGVTPIILVVVLGFFSAKLQMFSLNSAKELGPVDIQDSHWV